MNKCACVVACRLLLGAFAAPGVLVPLTAAASAVEADRNFVLRHGSMADLRLFDARERRDTFQEEQARFREADRVRGAGQPQRPLIPRLPRNCLPPPIGKNVLGSCR